MTLCYHASLISSYRSVIAASELVQALSIYLIRRGLPPACPLSLTLPFRPLPSPGPIPLHAPAPEISRGLTYPVPPQKVQS